MQNAKYADNLAEYTVKHSKVFKGNGNMESEFYEEEAMKLQYELVKLQKWIISQNRRLLVIVEGMDGAGKSSTIKEFSRFLNPREARTVALPKPNSKEVGQWYFQRYFKQLPNAGEIIFFDRSWYNRAGVERVMEFCTPKDYQKFMGQVPMFEQMLVEDGVLLFKYYLEIEKKEQKDRIESRKTDPLKRWKLSDMDLKSLELYDDYTKAKEEMLARTHSPYSPWIIVNSNDKKRARLNIIKDILSHVDYDGKKDSGLSLASDPSIVSLYSHLAHY